MNNSSNYKSYLKYKNKYLNLKNQIAGTSIKSTNLDKKVEPSFSDLSKKVPKEIFAEIVKLGSCKNIIK